MTRALPCHLLTGALGLLMGITLSRAGFSDFAQIQHMFRFEDWRLTMSFAAAAGLAALAFRAMRGPRAHAPRRFHPGTIPGGLLFGAGWALCGACPSIAWVQLGEGKLLAVATLCGIVAGTELYPRLHARWFHWPSESCQG